jgi:hypothetical protein
LTVFGLDKWAHFTTEDNESRSVSLGFVLLGHGDGGFGVFDGRVLREIIEFVSVKLAVHGTELGGFEGN